MNTAHWNTTLWQAAFNEAHCRDATQRLARQKLLSSLDDLDGHVADLLTRIPSDCKGLTLHDIAHAHQLWDVASTLCGLNYPINPLEGFVLGAAFLIHDAGLTAAAYPGGSAELRKTKKYLDLVASALKRADPNGVVDANAIEAAPCEITDRAMFELLRDLHAARAEKILDQEYVHPAIGAKFTLIPVDKLFDLGDVIGRVAASHHWDVKAVDRSFGDPEPPPAAYPGWTIDAVKLACILRAADACAIDERRARTMAFLFENPRGVSRAHWQFQSYLNPGHLAEGAEALVFRSKRSLPRSEMDAWWVAFDAIALADRELRACDRLLKRRAGKGDHNDRIPLSAKRVEGAADAEALANCVRVEGWRPVDTAARINDPTAIIESLGGRNLYGDDVSAPLRELLQNAADAVRARRFHSGYGQDVGEFPGKIKVSMEKPHAAGGPWTLTVSDDGIGMPEDVLTGEFLDFGKSLWRSDRLSSLYPGLAANNDFRPTGRFGIGFYSVFMISHDVKVMSKSFRDGDSSRRVLHFKHGVKGRAELRSYDQAYDGHWPHNANTVVAIKLDTPRWLGQFASYARDTINNTAISIESEEYWQLILRSLERLVFCLDASVSMSAPFLQIESINKTEIFRISSESFADEWNRVFATKVEGSAIDTRMVSLIRTVGQSAQSNSRGCVQISTSGNGGICHVGGLTVLGVQDGTVRGIVECYPKTANRRAVGRSAPKDNFIEWGEEQLKGLYQIKLENNELAEGVLKLFDLGVDICNHYFLTDFHQDLIYLNDIVLNDSAVIFLACERDRFTQNIAVGSFSNMYHNIGPYFEKSRDFTFVFGNAFGWHHDFYNLIALTDAQGQNYKRTPYSRLLRCIELKGFDAEVEGPKEQVIGKYIGEDGGLGRFKDTELRHGNPVKAHGIVIHVRSKSPMT